MNTFHSYVVDLFGPDLSNEDLMWRLVISGYVFTIVQFFISFVLPAPYGRHLSSAPKFMTAIRLDARFSWFFQECPAFFICGINLWQAWDKAESTAKTVLALFLIHYFQRSFIFPLLIRSGNKSPLLTTLMAFGFCSFNGFLQSHSVLYVLHFNSSEYLSNVFIAGIILFFGGLVINIDSDRRLRLLRRSGSSSSYKVPHGGVFEYVSAANYFGEIVEWWGFALCSKLNPAAVFFAGFTTVFLGVRGIQNHRFYKEKFKEDYPKNRRAVIPFIV